MCMQVPAATGLTIRVINNVVKKMDVKPKFSDAFRKDGYSTSFEYRQKVLHLFPDALPRISHLAAYSDD